MENSKTLELKVGLAVGGGLFLFIISMFMLGGDNIFKSTYRLKARFDSIPGLGAGSVVQVLGIPVGNVVEVNVVSTDDKNNIEVVLKIQRDYQRQITVGSTAGLRTQGALGDKFIYITPGLSGGEPLKDGEGILAETRGGFLETLAESGDKIEKVFKVIDEVHALMRSINGNGRSETLMQNLSTASDGYRKSSMHLASVLEKIDNGSGTLGALVNDRSVFEAVKRFVGSPQDKFMKNVIRETIQTDKK